MSNREEIALKILFRPEVYPGLVKRNTDDLVFLLWINNSLGDYITWSLFVSNNKYYVRRVRWEQRSQYKLKNPETFATEYLIPQEIVSAVTEGLANLNLDGLCQKKKRIVIDGIEYGLKVDNKLLNWRDELEKEFTELVKWHKTTIERFNKISANRGDYD